MERYHLQQMQSLPLEAKIVKSQQRIREWYSHWEGNVFVSVSGKDSTVLLHIARDIYPNIPAVFCDTGLEWPEVKAHIKTLNNVDWIRPKISFKEIITTYGYPFPSKEQARHIELCKNTKSERVKKEKLEGVGPKKHFKISEKWKFLLDAPFKVSNKCCDILKIRPFNKYAKPTRKDIRRHPMMGVMAEESNSRRNKYLRYGCNAYDTRIPRSHPLGFWTEQDVLRFIKENNISIPSIYGEVIEHGNGNLWLSGVQRTGCMYCLFGFQYDIGESKFEILKREHPANYKYCMETLNMKEVIDHINSNIRYRERIRY